MLYPDDDKNVTFKEHPLMTEEDHKKWLEELIKEKETALPRHSDNGKDVVFYGDNKDD